MSMYAECGSSVDARSVFERLSKTNFAALLSVFFVIIKDEYCSALAVFLPRVVLTTCHS